MPALIPGLFALAALTQNTTPPAAELRAALDALRDGVPGEPAFEAALPRIGDLIRSDNAWFRDAGAWLAGEHGRRECVPDLLATLPKTGHERDELTDLALEDRTSKRMTLRTGSLARVLGSAFRAGWIGFEASSERSLVTRWACRGGPRRVFG
ncbi:MAG: hypothetical protein HOP15_17500 [Planctomycetes bacterium]|nr:hypothetical protein [Planctomycetota bacterium]